MSLKTCLLLLGFNLLIILLVIHVYIYSEKSLDTMIHVCINTIAYLCNFILLFLPFSYINLYIFFFFTKQRFVKTVHSAKESKLRSGLSQTPYNGFVIHLKKNKHSWSIAQAMHQYKSLTGATEFKTISFDVLKTFREKSVKYIFF